MQVITRFSNSFDNLSHHKIIKQCKDNLLTINNIIDNISESFNAYLNKDVIALLVYSNSKTIELVIQKIPQKLIKTIYIMKSVPGGEGVALFNALRNIDVLSAKLILIDDEEAYALIDEQKINYLILGCDKFHDKWFVNKIGSARLIRQAKDHNVPVLVLTQKWKKSLSATHPVIKSELLELVKYIDEISIITD